MNEESLYRDDLAAIHIDGYGFHWERAAPVVLKWLRQHGIEDGLLVDLGCGGGQWLARAAATGFATVGIDVSPAMVQRAQLASPTSKFVCGSFDEVPIPSCDAVTSLGEPLNYLNSIPRMRRVIQVVSGSIRAGGLFVFDVRHPPSGPVEPVDRVRSASDWFCHSRIEENADRLTRYITTFRRDGDRFRRDEEIHRLQLASRSEMLEWLREDGFEVEVFGGYGEYELSTRQSVFVCRKK